MWKGKAILAVIPARGGSKGVKLKNIHPLLGRPLLAYVGDIVCQVGCFDKAVVSTDHLQIAEVAQAAGLDVPFFRPEALSGDRIGDFPVLQHALSEAEAIYGARYDVVVMLQPTCPLRKPKHVMATIDLLIEGNWEAVWTVSPTDLKYHPLKALRLGTDQTLALYDQRGSLIVARQQLEPVYHRNGAAYAFTRGCLLDGNTILPERTTAVIVREPLISIDTLDDFELVAQIMQASPQATV